MGAKDYDTLSIDCGLLPGTGLETPGILRRAAVNVPLPECGGGGHARNTARHGRERRNAGRRIHLPAQTKPPQQDGAALFDQAALMRHVGDDRELLKEIVELFLETVPHLLKDIRDAVGREDDNGLRTAAHALRGAARNFYAPGVEQAALALEQMGQSRALRGASSAYAELEKELDKVRPLLQAMLPDDGSGGTS